MRGGQGGSRQRILAAHCPLPCPHPPWQGTWAPLSPPGGGSSQLNHHPSSYGIKRVQTVGTVVDNLHVICIHLRTPCFRGSQSKDVKRNKIN